MLRHLPLLTLLFFLHSFAHADSLEGMLMPGNVIAGHAKFEPDCSKCHAKFNKAGQSKLCLDCHKETAADIRQKTGFHGRLKENDCRNCHTEHKGRNASISSVDEKNFNHNQTDFTLKGAHKNPKVVCKECHKPGIQYRKAPRECIGCHKKDDTHKGSLGTKCETCHNEKDWKDATFDHSKTKFPLLGKHDEVKCKDCHKDTNYKETPKACIACHRKDDKHKGRFGEKCQTCHTERDWKTILFNHDKHTKFALHGKHRSAECESCHKAPLYKEKLRTTCISCHRADDVHKGSLGEKCESCHNERLWTSTSFDHDKDTKFPLRDKHKSAKCQSCHSAGNYKEKLPLNCFGCHKKDDEHKSKYDEKCETCHDEKAWKPSNFNHDRDTKYALRGKHFKVKCESCHKGVLYKEKLSSTCYDCHQADDKHKGQEGKKCEQCHSEKDWKESNFDHSKSKFPLLGKHYKVECKKCHLSLQFKDAPSDCYACHKKEDVHKRTLGTECARCHNSRDWKIWDFNHDKDTKFKLDGAHKPLECMACHNRPMDKNTRKLMTCYDCHSGDDVHENNFGQQCQRCHVTTSFKKIKPGINISF
jgi:hypothetical protein